MYNKIRVKALFVIDFKQTLVAPSSGTLGMLKVMVWELFIYYKHDYLVNLCRVDVFVAFFAHHVCNVDFFNQWIKDWDFTTNVHVCFLWTDKLCQLIPKRLARFDIKVANIPNKSNCMESWMNCSIIMKLCIICTSFCFYEIRCVFSESFETGKAEFNFK